MHLAVYITKPHMYIANWISYIENMADEYVEPLEAIEFNSDYKVKLKLPV